MNLTRQNLLALMEEAVEFSLRHVDAGGLPFVGVLLGREGYVSAPGVNRAHESGDPSAHAEIVAMRTALTDTGHSALTGTWLLATGEPCGLCYRFALEHGVSRIFVAVDRDEVAKHGFDYRASYQAYGISHSLLAEKVRQFPVEQGLEPFQQFTRLRQDNVITMPSNPSTPTKGNKS